MLRAILIDDEAIALDVMAIQLDRVGGVEICGRYQSVQEAVSAVPPLQPDILFLDVEMPGEDGLSGAERLKAVCPNAEIVFVTAYPDYAMPAFDRQAMGYLLKPVREEKLAATVARCALMIASTAAASGAAAEPDPLPGLSLQVMGSLQLYGSDGSLLTWRTKKTKELFAYLWHYRGHPVYRYHILDALWPNHPPERAQTLLHTSLYYLRSMLKAAGYPEIVRFGDERYWLDYKCIRSDADTLELALGEGREEKLADEKLYRGDYMETEHYEWASAKRFEMRAAYIRGLSQAAAAADGELRSRLLWRLSSLEPLHPEYLGSLLDGVAPAKDAGNGKREGAGKPRSTRSRNK